MTTSAMKNAAIAKAAGTHVHEWELISKVGTSFEYPVRFKCKVCKVIVTMGLGTGEPNPAPDYDQDLAACVTVTHELGVIHGFNSRSFVTEALEQNLDVNAASTVLRDVVYEMVKEKKER